MLWAIFIAWLCLVCAQPETTLFGAGSIPLDRLSSLYGLASPGDKISYTLTSFSQIKAQFALSRADFIISQTPLQPYEHTQSECNGVYDVREFPINLDGLAIIYSIPGVDVQNAPAPLLLDRTTLVMIYNGSLTKWSDYRLKQLNPVLDQSGYLTDDAIVPFYIEDSSISDVFSGALASFSDQWGIQQTLVGQSNWPYSVGTAIANLDGGGSDRIQAAVLSANSALGFVPYSQAQRAGLKNIAQMINKANNEVVLSRDTLNAAAQEYLPRILALNNLTNANPYNPPAGFALNIVDGSDNSWPLSYFNMITLRTSSSQDCLKAKAMHGFLQWTITSPSVVDEWSVQGNVLLPAGIISSLLRVVNKMACCQRVDGGGTSKVQIYGSGTYFSAPAIFEASALFSSLSSYASIPQYIISENDNDEQSLIAGVVANQQDFAITLNIPEKMPSLYTLPLFGGAVVCIYNIGGLQNPLTLSLPMVHAIFSGAILNWDEILGESGINRSISVVHKAELASSTIFNRIFIDSQVSFSYGTQQEIVAEVQSIPDSIGLVVLTSDLSSLANISVANMFNPNGAVVRPGLQSLTPSFAQMSYMAAVPSNTTWPFVAMSYINFKVGSGTFCPTAIQLAQFIYWLYSDTSAVQTVQTTFSVLPPFESQIAAMLKAVMCDGIPLISPRLVIPGAGATFAAGVYTSWLSAYAFIDSTVEITYQGTGSGAGINAILANSIVWAGSDAPLTTAQYEMGKDLQMYPAFAGTVVLAYRIDALGSISQSLNLTREVIVDIYLGHIQYWDDQSITMLNPAASALLPHKQIVLVYRSDSSGTTNIFTNALRAFSNKWTIAPANSISWPMQGITGMGSSGVGLRVFSNDNSLGYVELTYALSTGLSYTSIRNKAGNWVLPSVTSVQSAMNDFKSSFTPELTCTIVDGQGALSWPITAYTYIVLHTKSMSDFTTAQKVVEFIRWGMSSGTARDRTVAQGFSPLPLEFVETVIVKKLQEISVNGVPVLSIADSSEASVDRTTNLELGLGVGVGLGATLIIVIGIFLVYIFRLKRAAHKTNTKETISFVASEWDDSQCGKNLDTEMNILSDNLGGITINDGLPILQFGLPKGSRFPVGELLTERVKITNTANSSRDFRFYVPIDENRFKMYVVPGYGTLKKEETLVVEIQLTLLMTTTISRKAKFEVAGYGETILALHATGDVSTRLDPNEIDIVGKPIGKGAFGTVYRGTYRGTAVAIKVLTRQKELIKAQTDDFIKEIELMNRLRSPHVVNFIGASYIPGKLCVVTEFMEKGSLHYVIRNVKLEPALRLKIALDTAIAMAFLHNNGVVHRDLKPANVLMLSFSPSAEVTVKISDFGTSRTVKHIYASDRYTNGWGTPSYMAPELFARGEYSGKVDVYAFGILLLELYTQKDPFHFLKRAWDLADFIQKGQRPTIPENCPQDYAQLIMQCWDQSPDNRPTFPELVKLIEPMYSQERETAKEIKRMKRSTVSSYSGTSSPYSTMGPHTTGVDYYGTNSMNNSMITTTVNSSINYSGSENTERDASRLGESTKPEEKGESSMYKTNSSFSSTLHSTVNASKSPRIELLQQRDSEQSISFAKFNVDNVV